MASTPYFRPVTTIALALTLTLPGLAEGQGLEGDLAGLAIDNAELFVHPLTRGFGFAMSSGLFDGARPLGRLGFDVGLRATGAFPPTSAEMFTPILPTSVEWTHPVFGTRTYSDPYRVQPGSGGMTPTAAGDGPGAILEPHGEFRDDLVMAGENPSAYEIQFPEGLDIPIVPFPVLHASVGVGYGTELSFRFIPKLNLDDEIGDISARGFAVRHSVSQWVPSPLPVDVSVVLGTQSLEVDEYLDASSTQFGVIAGRDAGPLSVFASGIIRSGSVDISYTVENPEGNPGLPEDGTPIRFTEDLGTGMAFGLGARLSLLFMNISGQYTLDDYSMVSLKVGFGRP